MEIIVKLDGASLSSPQVTTQAAPQIVQPTPQAAPTPEAITDSQRIRLLGFFGLNEPTDNETSSQLQFIHRYMSRGAQTDADYLGNLIETRRKLGSPKFGETMHGKIYRYLRLIDQRIKIDQELNAPGYSL